MANITLTNYIWPNGIQKDSEGYACFYPLGTNKTPIPTSSSEWPKGNKLISPFVYQDDKLVGFCDTKALTVSGNTTIYLPYTHIEAQFSAINKGQLQIHAPKATTKKASWKDSGKEDIPEVQYKYKGCKTVNDVISVNADYQTTDIVNGTWSEPLWDLEQGGYGEWIVMGMFATCPNLTSFPSDLPSLTNGNIMFQTCSNLTSFSSNLPSLTIGVSMFDDCENLTTFTSDLPSLTNGASMFSGCKLDTASVQNIADTIKNVTSLTDSSLDEAEGWKQIDIGIGNSTPNNQEIDAFNTITSKGWTVRVNGSTYTPTSPAAITTLDENGEEIITPLPYYAKPVPATEETASYVDANGNYYNIVGAQFIYGDDLSTYGMFTCEEDAAANMRLTKIEKPQRFALKP